MASGSCWAPRSTCTASATCTRRCCSRRSNAAAKASAGHAATNRAVPVDRYRRGGHEAR